MKKKKIEYYSDLNPEDKMKSDIGNVSPKKDPQPHFVNEVWINQFLDFAKEDKKDIEFHIEVVRNGFDILYMIKKYVETNTINVAELDKLSNFYGEVSLYFKYSKKVIAVCKIKSKQVDKFKRESEQLRNPIKQNKVLKNNKLIELLEMSKEWENFHLENSRGDLKLKTNTFRYLVQFATNDVTSLIAKFEAKRISLKIGVPESYIGAIFGENNDEKKDLYKNKKLIKEVAEYLRVNNRDIKCEHFERLLEKTTNF